MYSLKFMLGKIWENGHSKMVSKFAELCAYCDPHSVKNKYTRMHAKTRRNSIKRKIVVTFGRWNAFRKCIFICFTDFTSVVVF